MRKGIFKGRRVTAFRWYMPRRVYGRITEYLGHNVWVVKGSFGIEQFHVNQIRPIKGRRA